MNPHTSDKVHFFKFDIWFMFILKFYVFAHEN